MTPECDALVIGAGPAGATAARLLALAGRRVLLVERRREVAPRIGETLPPQTRTTLRRLGLWTNFLALEPRASPGNLSAWGSAAPSAADFIAHPHGCGWHLDRARFDQLLVRAARDAGATVQYDTRVTGLKRYAHGWRVRVHHGEFGDEVTTHLLFLAAGRLASAPPGTPGRERHDQLVALYTFLPRSAASDSRTWIEARRDGWWYSAWLPNQRVVLARMTDGDLIPKGRDARARALRIDLKGSPLTRRRTEVLDPIRWHGACAASSRLPVATEPDWAAIGDAALAFDPLASTGVHFALESARCAVDALLAGKSGRYASWLDARWAQYLHGLRGYYALEARWTDSPFWSRRAATPS
jgi:flavin-dependent dehydrogenase